MGPIVASLITAILQRLNQAPAKNKLAFLDLLGLRVVPAQPARAPVVFTLSQSASDTSAPEGTQVAAPPPPGSTQQIVFSTEQDAAVAAATLTEVISLWPGRDQYINHSPALKAGQPFTLFQNLQLQQTDHILYLAHSKFLSLAGGVALSLTFDLSQGSSSPLEIAWEYWDGQVWRGFISNQPSCLDPIEPGSDGTNGLSKGGTIQLRAAGTQTTPTTVNGVQSYWIRGRLTQALLPDPNQLLPEADTIRLSTQISQPLELNVTATLATAASTQVLVQDDNAQPLNGATVTITPPNAAPFIGQSGPTTSGVGGVLSPSPPPLTAGSYQFDVSYDGISGTTYAQYDPSMGPVQITLVAKVEGLPPDKAYFEGKSLDTTKAFYPLGQVPAPGSTFYFKQNEVFSKPGANVQIYVAPGVPPGSAGSSGSGTGTPLPHTINWEYWNGFEWKILLQSQIPPAPVLGDFTQSEVLSFVVPQDMVTTAVNNEAGLWIRARLVAGGYGLSQTIQFTTSSNPQTTLTAAAIAGAISVTVTSAAGFTANTTAILSGSGNSERATIATVSGNTINFQSGLQNSYPIGASVTSTVTSTNTYSIPFVQPKPPIVAVFQFGYSWTQGPYPLEQVFTFNDFQYEDHTNDALWPGNPFTPYRPVSDVTPALYLGFNKQLPVNNFGMYFNIVEQAGVTSGPALVWEYWNGGEWAGVAVEDETQQLALPGMITFIPAADSQPLARFDNPLYWIRGRLKEDGPPDETTINNLYTNAVWASQWQTYSNSPLGTSTGVPNQIFQFNQIPILPGQEIEVQELSAPRANTEWRTLAMQVVPNDPNIITELEGLLAAEGPQTDIIIGNVHLVRDSTKSVIEVWIQWQEEQNFLEAGPSDRVYVLDHAMGRLFFGDGDSGMIPPLGAAIQATSFRSGGGLAGNVASGTITQLLGALSGVQGVANPRAAEGGADGETLEQYQLRAPSNIRNRGRAIVPQDYEAMAQEASAGVAVARAMPTLDPSGVTLPGWITLMIIPESQDPRPTPSAGLRQDVLNYLLQRAPADVAAGQRINVVGPTYLPVDVTATLAPIDPAQAGTVEQNVLNALAAFLNPLTGGPGGLGWDVGRGLYASDIASVLADVDGVDYVDSLALYVNGVLQGEQVQVPPGQIVVAGQFTVSLILPATI